VGERNKNCDDTYVLLIVHQPPTQRQLSGRDRGGLTAKNQVFEMLRGGERMVFAPRDLTPFCMIFSITGVIGISNDFYHIRLSAIDDIAFWTRPASGAAVM